MMLLLFKILKKSDKITSDVHNNAHIKCYDLTVG